MDSCSAEPPGTNGSRLASPTRQGPQEVTDASGPTRRGLLCGGLAAGIAVGAANVFGGAPAGATGPATTRRLRDAVGDPTAIHPFRVRFSTAQLAELRRRVAATRWPSRELVTDRSQGVQ